MRTPSYVVPFQVLLDRIEPSHDAGNGRFELSREQLYSMIRALLVSVPVDEEWYISTYPDVAQAIQDGAIKSAKEHFLSNGYFEGRLPAPLIVDEEFYVSEYPDVAESLELGEITSAQEHFELHGCAEGRQPFKV